MKIEILGMGCPKCQLLLDNVKKAVDKAGVTADIEKVEDMDKITEYAVMVTPALVIDGIVKSAGRIPIVDEIKEMIA